MKQFIYDMINLTEGQKFIKYWWLWIVILVFVVSCTVIIESWGEKTMKDIFKFDPWQQAEDKSESGCLNIDVSEPPCKHCKFWRPRMTTNEYGHQNGIVLCCNDEMYHDFSCFKESVIKNEIKS